jgi:hypothetical protein
MKPGDAMAKTNYNLSSLEGRANYIHGLAEAAKLIAAQETIKKQQLKLFAQMKPEDAIKIQ